MKRKSLWDIYKRNASVFFKQGFPDVDTWTIAFLPAVIVFIVLLPFTLSFGVGIKSLIDFFSRKEIPEEGMAKLNDKIAQSGEGEIDSLVKDISSYGAKSKSSTKLIQDLHSTSTETSRVIAGSRQAKKRALQEAQFNSENGSASVEDKNAAIANVKLNPQHQAELDQYDKENSSACTTQKVKKQKAAIENYLGAEHNSGKGMQHIIKDHFFTPPLSSVEKKAVNPADEPIKGLPVNRK